MDYQRIVLEGYLSPDVYFDKHLFRKFNDAQKNGYEANEFFDGCLNVLINLEKEIKKQFSQRKEALNKQLDRSKRKDALYSKIDGSLYPIDHRFEVEANTQMALNKLKLEETRIKLSNYTYGQFNSFISYDEIQQLRRFILSASKRVSKEEYIETQNIKKAKDININNFVLVNNFDEVEPQTVYNHFKSKLVDKNYLSIEDLNRWLGNAFQNRVKTNPKLNFENKPHKQKIREVFFIYSSEIASQHGRRKEYIELLTEHFEGHPYDRTMNNFKPKDYK